MAVNLVKHQEEMLRAWREVVDDKNPTNWALFSYEGQTYDLKLTNKGGISQFLMSHIGSLNMDMCVYILQMAGSQSSLKTSTAAKSCTPSAELGTPKQVFLNMYSSTG